MGVRKLTVDGIAKTPEDLLREHSSSSKMELIFLVSAIGRTAAIKLRGFGLDTRVFTGNQY